MIEPLRLSCYYGVNKSRSLRDEIKPGVAVMLGHANHGAGFRGELHINIEDIQCSNKITLRLDT